MARLRELLGMKTDFAIDGSPRADFWSRHGYQAIALSRAARADFLVSPRSCRSGFARWLRWVLAAMVALPLIHVPVLAWATAAEDAEIAAKKGGESFKNNQFYEAAVQFERAAQLDPTDPKNLRYAGRAWQELGHLKRALVLLEAYLRIESNAEYRASIMDKIEVLRRATPLQLAEALTAALTKYPQARLESEAARAWEAVGTEDALNKAVELWEVARVRAMTDGDKATAEAGIQRVAQRRLDVKAAQERDLAAAKRDQQERDRLAQEQARLRDQPGQPSQPGDPGGAGLRPQQMVLYTAGGIALVGGVSLAIVGYLGAVDVNDRAAKGEYKSGPYIKYTEDLQAQDNLAYAGWGLAALGAGAVGWAWLSTPKVATPSKVSWQWRPYVGQERTGVVLAGSF